MNAQSQTDLFGQMDGNSKSTIQSGNGIAKTCNGGTELLELLFKGYGYTEANIPQGLGKTCRKLYQAMLEGDSAMLAQILHPDNKLSRAAFESLDPSGNLKLPKTVKGTNAVIEGYVARLQAALGAEQATATTTIQ